MAPQSSSADAFSVIRQLSVPDNWPGMPGGPGGISTYGSPPDLKGRLAVALDPTGQPVWDKTNWTNEPSDPLDDPYELDLSRYSARALPPFGEQRAVRQRIFDGRTRAVVAPVRYGFGKLTVAFSWSNLGLDPSKPGYDLAKVRILQNSLTTDSWDLPVPSLVASPSMRGFLGNATIPGRMTSIAELLHARLSVAGVQPNQIPVTIEGFLSPEVRRGLADEPQSAVWQRPRRRIQRTQPGNGHRR